MPKLSPDHYAQNGIQKKRLYSVFGIFVFFSFQPVGDKQIYDRKGQQIHQTIIPYLKRAELNEVRVNMLRDVVPPIHALFHYYNSIA